MSETEFGVDHCKRQRRGIDGGRTLSSHIDVKGLKKVRRTDGRRFRSEPAAQTRVDRLPQLDPRPISALIDFNSWRGRVALNSRRRFRSGPAAGKRIDTLPQLAWRN